MSECAARARPFDHPSLTIPNGGVVDQRCFDGAIDHYPQLPAAAGGAPLARFLRFIGRSVPANSASKTVLYDLRLADRLIRGPQKKGGPLFSFGNEPCAAGRRVAAGGSALNGFLQVRSNEGQTRPSAALQVFDNLGGDQVRLGQIGGVFQAFIFSARRCPGCLCRA